MSLLDKKKVTLLPKVQKRILNDVSDLNKNIDELHESGIYWHIDENDIQKIWVVITGQDGTPYANAPFLFEFTFSDNYPLVPPYCKFCTTDGKTRFNPNLYIDGKICLSILGTWSGPSWVPVMNTKTIIMSIIALVMTGEPLKNEPGWENSSVSDIEEYNAVVEYRSLRVGILETLRNCPAAFMPMLGKMEERFKRDFQKIMERIEENILKFDGREMKPRYGSHWRLNYTDLRNDMLELGKKYGLVVPPKIEQVFDDDVELDIGVVEQVIKRPKKSAALFDSGYQVNMFGVIYEVKENKNGKKFWRKLN